MIQLISLIQARLAAARDDDRGATIVEYGLLVTLVAIALIVTLGALTGQIDNFFAAIGNAITAENP